MAEQGCRSCRTDATQAQQKHDDFATLMGQVVTAEPVWTMTLDEAIQLEPHYQPAEVYRALVRSSICFRDDLPQSATWCRCDGLLADDGQLWAECATQAQRTLGFDYLRSAASFAFQHYCHRLAGVTVVIWLVTGQTFDASPEVTDIGVENGMPVAFRYLTTDATIATADDLLETLYHRHLYPLAVATHKKSKSSLANLRGNIAASIGLAAEYAGRWRDVNAIYARLRALLDRAPQLDRMGSYRTMTGPRGARVRYARKSCCHRFEIPGRDYCCWCSHLDDETMQRFLTAAVAAEVYEELVPIRSE